MAGVITHLVIAREIDKLLSDGTIVDKGLFYAGAFAPDAIHARENYVRTDKKHTHLRDNIMDKDFITEENLTLFHQRVANFIMDNSLKEEGLQDMYRGYVIHLLTDELYMLTLRAEFCETMEKLGISQSDKEFFTYIVEDMYRNDFILTNNYEGIEEIRKHLEEVKSFQIRGFLSEKEISDCKDWLGRHYFIEKCEVLEPVYISHEKTLDFIKLATTNIVERLSEGGSLPRMW